MRNTRSNNFGGGSGKHDQDNEKTIKKSLFTAKKPLTRRQISVNTGIEICTLCLPLLQLVKAGTLYIAYRCPCPLTGNKCYHYTLSSWKGAANG